MRVPTPLRPAHRLAPILALPAARLTTAVSLGILVVALLAGLVRVLPILLAPGVPARIALPLARGVVGVSLETALFVAPPVAWALAAARVVDRGEARALLSLGVSPGRLVASAWPAALIVAFAGALAVGSWGREAIAPGRLARGLLSSARAACVARAAPARPAVVDVPLLGLSWICFANDTPRIVGPAPFGGGAAAFAATGLDVSDDLRSVALAELSIAVPLSERGSGRDLVVAAHRATITRLAPLGRASNIRVVERVLLLVCSSLAMAWLAAALIVRSAISGRVIATMVGAIAPACALLVFSALERGPTRPLVYLAVPAVGLGALGLTALVLAFLPLAGAAGSNLVGRIARPAG